MVVEPEGPKLVADVKCYHCGHISGQIVAERNQPLRVSNFVPRPGYHGQPPRRGERLRCERCGGPVFLENATVVNPRPSFSEGLRSRPKLRGARKSPQPEAA
jgi:hypothetical protein